MKRAVAHLMLFCLLLTGVGHYALLIGLKEKSSREISKRLEGDMYDLGGSMTIKVPVGLPYVTNEQSYEPAYGTYTDNGNVYQIIKRRVYRDTLYLVCLKDEQSTEIHQAITAFVQSFAGDDDDSNKNISYKLSKDYVSTEINLTPSSEGWLSYVWSGTLETSLPDPFIADISHPPAA